MRGYQRLWFYLKDNVIDYLTEAYGNELDWYVSFWETRTTDLRLIESSLSDQNLVHCSLLNDNQLFVNSVNLSGYHELDGSVLRWLRLAYLDQYLSTIKCRYELSKNITYDEILFIRSDVLYEPIWWTKGYNNVTVALKPLWYTTDMNNTNLWHDYAAFEDDVHLRFGQPAGDIYANRFLDLLEINPKFSYIDSDAHSLLWIYLSRSVLRKYVTPYSFGIRLVRPNTNLAELKKNFMYGQDSLPEWNQLHDSVKSDICWSQNIDPIEYGINDLI